jgi:threonine synthase
MKYYSLNHNAPKVSFEEAVIQGLATDRGLYFPENISPLPAAFFDTIEKNFERSLKTPYVLIFQWLK